MNILIIAIVQTKTKFISYLTEDYILKSILHLINSEPLLEKK